MGRARHVIWPNQKNLYFSNNEPILSSMPAAGIVQDTLLEKLEKASAGGEVETTEATSTTRAGNSSRFVAFLSQITNTRTRFRNVCTYVYMKI